MTVRTKKSEEALLGDVNAIGKWGRYNGNCQHWRVYVYG